MLKKLQNLLFEDEELEDEELEDEEEDDEEEEVVVKKEKPARRRRGRRHEEEEEEEEVEVVPEPPVQKPVYQAKPEPAPAAKPVLKRVEVTQAISVPKAEPAPQETPAARKPTAGYSNAAFQKPAAPVQHATPRPIYENRPAQEPAPVFRTPEPQQHASSFGISADDTVSAGRTQPRRQEPQQSQSVKRPGAVYEFRPVISPMFGVDEKDINAMAYIAKPEPMDEPDPTHHATQLLSPIYGANEGTPEKSVTSEMQRIPSFDGSAYQPQPQPDENTFPEFSLDDILSARDEEFTRQNVINNNQEYRTPDIDETAVIDSNQYSPYDQQTLDFDRKR